MLSEFDFADSPLLDRTAVVVPKNDTPNRFWASTEPYCGDITQVGIFYKCKFLF